ncbi:uncharacterized protein EI90DRAFT_3011823 [Cantharellus anzutake]|uniref:uncharacterized protein n=1 Tax=Cantharellus anzutake TaxID=1750568 RepID=UPI001906BCEA|nr:uncharacterized protein EI90DRAFT_3011823 [Cantharellus anzutake]KAF8342330.1 hypothetical protein EI90DRAFT_3011823 [Cantharellus anzutake]
MSGPITYPATHIYHLPDEILNKILVFAVLGCSNSLLPLDIVSRNAITSVSKLWHSLAIDEPRIWSRICMNHIYSREDWRKALRGFGAQPGMHPKNQAYLERLPIWFSRSKDLLLDVTITFTNASEGVQNDVKKVAWPYLGRCRSLNVSFYLDSSMAGSGFMVDNTFTWFPLPNMPHLDVLSICLVSGGRYQGTRIHLGPPLTLRQFELTGDTYPIFDSEITAVDHLSLTDLNGHSVFKALQHCPDVRQLTLQRTERPSPPFPPHLSFPSLEVLKVTSSLQFPIEAAPNLKHLDCFSCHDPHQTYELVRDYEQCFSNLEIFAFCGLTVDTLRSIGNQSFIRSENLKAIISSWGSDPRTVIEFFSLPISPDASYSPMTLTEGSVDRPFPALKLLVIDDIDFDLSVWHSSSGSLVDNLEGMLGARPELVLYCVSPNPRKAVTSTVLEFARRMGGRFVITHSRPHLDADESVEQCIWRFTHGRLQFGN